MYISEHIFVRIFLVAVISDIVAHMFITMCLCKLINDNGPSAATIDASSARYRFNLT